MVRGRWHERGLHPWGVSKVSSEETETNQHEAIWWDTSIFGSHPVDVSQFRGSQKVSRMFPGPPKPEWGHKNGTTVPKTKRAKKRYKKPERGHICQNHLPFTKPPFCFLLTNCPTEGLCGSTQESSLDVPDVPGTHPRNAPRRLLRHTNHEIPSWDERQITHLICARLKYDLYDFSRGVLGLLPVLFLV